MSKKINQEQVEYVAPVADKNYKMSKPIKRRLALGGFKNKADRDGWRKLFIEAEVSAKSQQRAVYDKPVGKNYNEVEL